MMRVIAKCNVPRSWKRCSAVQTPSIASFVHSYCRPWMVMLWYGPALARCLSTPPSSTTTPSSSAAGGGRVNSGNNNNNNMLPPLLSFHVQDHLPLAHQAMAYFDASPDPFHAVRTSIDLLHQAGFEELPSSEHSYYQGRLRPGGKYYFTRNKSTLVAFHVGCHYQPGNGFIMIGGHTDSPNLKVKTRSKRSSSSNGGGSGIQIGVECYGGGLWHTWFDRDLGLSGRVMIRSTNKSTTTSSSTSDAGDHGDGDGNDKSQTSVSSSFGTIEQRLIKIDRAILRISNLAIHLRTEEERKAFAVNKEDHLSPILAMAAQKALTTGTTNDDGNTSNSDIKEVDELDEESKKKDNDKKVTKKDGWTEYQEPILLQLLASELNVAIEDIVDFELNLFDVQRASLGGAYSEFIYSARLDNLASCFLAVQALIEHSKDMAGDDDNDAAKPSGADEDIAMIVLYDHEEVGSGSAVGAASPIMGDAVDRISAAFNGGVSSADLYQSAIRKSFVLSSDQAHAVHPNYASKHEKAHQPKMNEGMVIKRNSNQRYATNGVTGLLIREVARRAKLPPVQEFMVRQDCGCGSTIGPLISTATGIRAIDMGCPQLSMHSIRETMGVCDLTHGLALFKAYFKHFREVDLSVEQ